MLGLLVFIFATGLSHNLFEQLAATRTADTTEQPRTQQKATYQEATYDSAGNVISVRTRQVDTDHVVELPSHLPTVGR
jgi:YD repeat-containing protein